MSCEEADPTQMKTVQVQYFALLREQAGCGEESIATVASRMMRGICAALTGTRTELAGTIPSSSPLLA